MNNLKKFTKLEIKWAEKGIRISKALIVISFSKFNQKEFVDIAEFQPKYLKEFGGKKINT